MTRMDVILHALADDSRRTMLDVLRDGPVTVGELARRLPIARPGVSQHHGSAVIGSIRAENGRGTVRMEDVFDTTNADLWPALTAPERLARWIGDVPGELGVGGTIQARLTSGWEGPARVDVCDARNRLVAAMCPGSDEDTASSRPR